MVDVAEVKIWGEMVGAVRWDASEQLASFQFSPSFLSKGIDLAPLKMPIANGNRIYRFPDLRKSTDDGLSTFKGLPGLLADMLPDRYGNQLINVWLARNDRAPNSMNPVEQLCFIGSRGMGALEFEPARPGSANQAFDVEIASLVEAATSMMNERADFSAYLKDDEEKAIVDVLKIGTSAGGARPKAVVAYNEETGEFRSGQAQAPDGFEHWLIKLDGVNDAQFGVSHGYGRVEYAYHLMARDAGIEMMDCRLVEENGRAHFMTKRYDRLGSQTKHHVQTFCAMQHFDYTHITSFSYEQLFQTMRMLRLTYGEAEQMFKRMVFNVMATNFDDHTKNFAFLLKQNGNWQLAPAYDLCHSYDPSNQWVSQHTLSINGKHRDISREDLLQLADSNSVKKADKIIDQVQAVVCQWRRYASEVDVHPKLLESIDATLYANSFR